jgi:hypothetical protein
MASPTLLVCYQSKIKTRLHPLSRVNVTTSTTTLVRLIKISNMKNVLTTALLAIALHSDFTEGQTYISNGTYIHHWPEPCSSVIDANTFYGSCCSFSDIGNDENRNKCQLMIAGEDGACGWNNNQYLEDCTKVGECVSGPYYQVVYEPGVPVEKCPGSQYMDHMERADTSGGQRLLLGSIAAWLVCLTTMNKY